MVYRDSIFNEIVDSLKESYGKNPFCDVYIEPGNDLNNDFTDEDSDDEYWSSTRFSVARSNFADEYEPSDEDSDTDQYWSSARFSIAQSDLYDEHDSSESVKLDQLKRCERKNQ